MPKPSEGRDPRGHYYPDLLDKGNLMKISQTLVIRGSVWKMLSYSAATLPTIQDPLQH